MSLMNIKNKFSVTLGVFRVVMPKKQEKQTLNRQCHFPTIRVGGVLSIHLNKDVNISLMRYVIGMSHTHPEFPVGST